MSHKARPYEDIPGGIMRLGLGDGMVRLDDNQLIVPGSPAVSRGGVESMSGSEVAGEASIFSFSCGKSVDDVAHSAICPVRPHLKETHHLALGSLPRLNVMQISKSRTGKDLATVKAALDLGTG